MDPQPTNISSLSDYNLRLIFSLLDGKSVKNCALVCNRWNQLIGSSSAVLEKFKLRYWVGRNKPVEELKSLTRKVPNMRIVVHPFYSNGIKELDKDELDALAGHGSSVKDLEVSDVLNFNILSSFQNLQKLNLSEISCEPCETPVTMHHLKVMSLHDVSLDVLSKLAAPDLMDVTLSFINLKEDARDVIVDFLKNCLKLKEVALHMDAATLIFSQEVHDIFKFQLSKYTQLCGQINENFIEFLKSQAGSLKELDIGLGTHLRNLPQLLDVIYNDLQLISLGISEKVLSDESFWLKPKPNGCLKKVQFCGIVKTKSKIESFVEFLTKTPNLETLDTNLEDDNFLSGNLELVASLLPNLKSLNVHNINCFQTARFQKLRNLRIWHVADVKALCTFLTNNPTVKGMSVQFVDNEEEFQVAVEILKKNRLNSQS